jgi:hypothetical protein
VTNAVTQACTPHGNRRAHATPGTGKPAAGRPWPRAGAALVRADDRDAAGAVLVADLRASLAVLA